jgi:hypothetical protein
MNCDTIQHQLLESESPARPDPDILAHLDGCAACREWHARLVHIEQSVRLVPVPGSATRDAFLLDLVLPDNPSEAVAAPKPAALAARPSSEPVVRLSTPVGQSSPPLREVLWTWRYAAAAVAATVALFALVSWSLQQRDKDRLMVNAKERPDPLVASLMQHDLVLVTATPEQKEQRLDALRQMARDLDQESHAVQQDSDLAGLLSQLRTQVTEVLQKLDPQARLAVADAATPAEPRRIKQLQRNRKLIQTLVEGGLRLAGIDDTLDRADSCKQLAKGLASEIRDAAQHREGDRALEMGQHLRDLLQQGVAGNIRSVRPTVHHGSLAEKHLYDVQDWVSGITGSLEKELAANTELQGAADAIRGGREQVESAVRG